METTDFNLFFQELDKHTVIAFVKDSGEMQENMKNAYEKTKELYSAETRRISFEEALRMKLAELKERRYIFIMSKFDGEAYDYLSNMDGNHLILGVPMLECILEQQTSENKTVINKSRYRRIFTNAFNDITLCISNIRSPEKTKIIRMVKFMNGRISDKFDSNVTHLLTNTTKSIKYCEAAALNTPIYHYKWVESVWNKCMDVKNYNMKADSEKFNLHQLPALFDLKITSSRLTKEQKSTVESLIDENGGDYSDLYSNDTDILLLNEKDTTNPKYQHAVRRKIPILKCSWVEESVKAGYSLPYEDFCFNSSKSRDKNSSKGEDDTPIFRQDSQMSDTLYNEEKIPSDTEAAKDEPPERAEERQFIASFKVADLKKLNNFLDGFVFYLHKYPPELVTKMRKIIVRCGGMSIESLNESFTHLLCYGDVDLKEIHKMMSDNNISATAVYHKWILQSLKQMAPESEKSHIIHVSQIKKADPLTLRNQVVNRTRHKRRLSGEFDSCPVVKRPRVQKDVSKTQDVKKSKKHK